MHACLYTAMKMKDINVESMVCVFLPALSMKWQHAIDNNLQYYIIHCRCHLWSHLANAHLLYQHSGILCCGD